MDDLQENPIKILPVPLITQQSYKSICGLEIDSSLDERCYLIEEDVDFLIKDPITFENIVDPVILNGNVYDSESLKKWFKNSNRDPLTGCTVSEIKLVTVRAIKYLLMCLEESDYGLIYHSVPQELFRALYLVDKFPIYGLPLSWFTYPNQKDYVYPHGVKSLSIYDSMTEVGYYSLDEFQEQARIRPPTEEQLVEHVKSKKESAERFNRKYGARFDHVLNIDEVEQSARKKNIPHGTTFIDCDFVGFPNEILPQTRIHYLHPFELLTMCSVSHQQITNPVNMLLTEAGYFIDQKYLSAKPTRRSLYNIEHRLKRVHNHNANPVGHLHVKFSNLVSGNKFDFYCPNYYHGYKYFRTTVYGYYTKKINTTIEKRIIRYDLVRPTIKLHVNEFKLLSEAYFTLGHRQFNNYRLSLGVPNMDCTKNGSGVCCVDHSFLTFQGKKFVDICFKHTSLDGAIFIDCVFEKCSFSFESPITSMIGTTFIRTQFTDCDFNNCSKKHLTYAMFDLETRTSILKCNGMEAQFLP
jgi:hypothetical protein